MDEMNRPIVLRPPAWMPFVLLLAVGLGGFFYVAGKHLEIKSREPTVISVSGEGKAPATPDIASLSFGVTVQRKATAKAAMDELAKTMNAVIDAVKKSGVEEKDITTESLSLNPAYDWNEGKQIARGFDASQSLRVKVRDMDKTSDVLAAATNAGANNAGGVNFVIDDPEKARAQARDAAIKQAQLKAKVLADQLGMSLGKLKSYSEGGGYMPPMPYATRAMAGAMMEADMAQAPEIPVGEQEVPVQVQLTYELK
jgi:uncharacterized protein YggE